jgi:Spy/CpxP family protein refolding chaperone
MIFGATNIGTIGAALVVACLWAVPSYGQSRSDLHAQRGELTGDVSGISLPLLLKAANLTADQKAQVQQIMANHRARLRDLFSQLRVSQDQMANKLFSVGRLQEADLVPHVQQISQLRNQLAEEGLTVVLEIRGILTPEQIAKASQLKLQMQSLHSQMRSLWEADSRGR